MPMPGDQHRDTAATTNPFLEQKRHISNFSAAEIATLRSRLDKQLGPEYVSTRPGAGGGKVHYLAAEKAINLANEVFGFNGWSSSIQNVQIDFVDESPQSGKISLGLSTIVRVTIRDGTFHEDIGYGHIENCKGKAAAFEKAKKEAATDAMKRALRNFGNVLGNCLYDKDYLQKVQKVKLQPSRWDADRNLHRHPDFAPIKPEVQQVKKAIDDANAQQRQASLQSNASFGSIEFEDDFGGNMFDETDFSHPDEMRLDDTAIETPERKVITGPGQPGGQQRQGVQRMQSMPQLRPPNIQNPPPVQAPQAPQRMQGPPRPPNNGAQGVPPRMPPPQQSTNLSRSTNSIPQYQGTVQADATSARSNPSSATADSPAAGITNHQPPHPQNQIHTDDAPPRMPPPGNPEGFVSGRSAELLNLPAGSRPANAALPFNSAAQATTIRRTPGIDPAKSAPIMRSIVQQPPQQPAPAVNGHPQVQQVQQQNAAPAQRPQSPAPATNGLNGTTTPVRTNFVTPSADVNRRIGMPPSAAGIQNRGTYRLPATVNAGAPGGVKRPPLTDVSNIQQMDGTGEAKKIKLDHPPEKTVDGEVQQDSSAPTAVGAP